MAETKQQGGVAGGVAIASQLLQIAPAILQLILQLESIFKRPKSGAAKKKVVMSTVATAPAEVQEQVSVLVDDAVAAMNGAAQ